MTRSKIAVLKTGETVVPRWFIPGFPVGLTSDTWAVIREIRRKDKRARIERDDGRAGSWWVDFDAIRRLGEQ